MNDQGSLRLNIASGPNMFPGWLNLDHVDQTSYLDAIKDAGGMSGWPQHQVDLAEHARAGRIAFKVHDLRKGFAEYADGSVDAIYLGQMIEHLNPIAEAPQFLSECYRMLRPGGVIRITTPDLELLLDAYQKGELGKFASEQPAFYAVACPSAQLSYLMFGACGPDCTSDRYEGHFCCYSREHLSLLLRGAGFTGELEFFRDSLQSIDPEAMADTVDCGMSHSLCCEARKP